MPSDKNIPLVMKRNHKYLVDNLKKLNSLTKILYEKKLISSENVQNFTDGDQGKGGNRRLSFLLSSSINTEVSFKKFLQALKDTDNTDIAYRLAPNENLEDFDQLDNNQANFDAIDYDVNQVYIKTLNKAELDSRVNNTRNYPMSLQLRSKNRLGRVLIINNNNFIDKSNRDGSEKDVELLKAVFECLHYNVQTAIDLTAEELWLLLQKERECFNKFNHKGSHMESGGKEGIGKEFDGRRHEQTNENNHEDNNGDTVERLNPNNTTQTFTKDNKASNESEPREEDYKGVCVFILVVMSHGGKGHVYGTDGTESCNNVSIDEIMNTFNGEVCPGLNNIPKLVFIQACQEDDVSNQNKTEFYRKGVERKNQSTTHKMADSFLMLSTVQVINTGEKALRNIKKGTYFIHILCKTIATKCHYWGLSDIVTEINALHRSIIIKRTNGIFLQHPENSNKLSRRFFFLP